MFCGECGTQNPETNMFCKNCGKPLKKSLAQNTTQSHAPLAPAAPYIPPSPSVVTVKTPTSGFMGTLKSRKILVASIICGVVSALILPYILGVVAIILGIWAIYKKDKLGVIGIIIGLLVVFVNYFYLIIFP